MNTWKSRWFVAAVLAGSAFCVPTSAQTDPSVSLRQPDVIYVPTPQPVVDAMLRLAKLQPGEKVYDLGCGDGRAVVTAARDFGAHGVGVDIDPARVRDSKANVEKAAVGERVEIRQADLFEMEFSDADVLFLYLLPSLNVRLRPRILDELKAGTRVVSNSFRMGDWEPDQSIDVAGRVVFYWVVPAKVAGEWAVQIPGEGEAMLTLEQTYQNATGTLKTKSGSFPITDGRIRGPQLAFTYGDGAKARRVVAEIKGAELTAEARGDAAGEPQKWTGRKNG